LRTLAGSVFSANQYTLTGVDVADTEGAVANCYARHITNDSAASVVRVCPSAAAYAAGLGILLGPGESLEMQFAGALYFKGTVGQTVTVCCLKYA
jgi:hypothetical protein